MDTNLRLTSLFEANAHGFIQWDFARRTNLEWRHANRHDPLCVRTLQQRLDEQVADKSKAAHRSFSAGYLAHSRSLGFKVWRHGSPCSQWSTNSATPVQRRSLPSSVIPSGRTRDPIDGWEIWIAKINPNRWRGRITHVAGTLYEVKHSPLNARPHHQITTDRCDRQSNSYYFPPELDMSMPEIEEYGSALGLTRIWPTTETPPHCPVRVLFDADAENVAYSLINVLAKVYGIQPLVPVRN